jgi:glycosyltransferase involved in cell wall biosynthesis
MKVMLVHNRYQQPGGEDRVFESECELLTSHGHDVLRHEVHNDAVGHRNRLRLALGTTWSRTAYREIRALLERERPHIVHVHNTLPLISPAVYYAAADAGLPVVQTVHNYRLICPKAQLLRDGHVCEDCVGRRLPWPGIVHACYRESRAATSAVALMLGVHWVLGTWTRRVDRYIALTHFMRRKLIEGGLPAGRIVVKPNFVAPDPGAGEHDGGYALFVGRLSPEKGLHTLLRAWAHIGDRLPLKIAGSGPQDGLADGAALGVEWLSRVSHRDVLALMQHASLLIVPSEWYEGFPAIIAEACATALPVVASRLGALAEIVEDGRTGLLFTPGDARDLAAKVTWALDHPREVAEMTWRTRAEYETKYSAERNYGLLLATYREVLAETRSPGSARAPIPVLPGNRPVPE